VAQGGGGAGGCLQREGPVSSGRGRGRGHGGGAHQEDGGELLRGRDRQPAGMVLLRMQKSLLVLADVGGSGARKKSQLYIWGSLVLVHGINRDQWINSPD
jgi:hypothetical protein